MEYNKNIIILVGPKGSGKTYIGNLVQDVYGIQYINAEKLLLEYLEKNPLIKLPLPRHGFDIEIDEIAKFFKDRFCLIYDMTGTSEYFTSVINELKTLYRVHLIKVSCPLFCCDERIKKRSVTNHFAMDMKSINDINKRAIAVKCDWDLEIINDAHSDSESIIRNLDDYFYKTNICLT
jgi:hypothetical protein